MTHLPVISWIINNKCNLFCPHCYPDSGKEIRPPYSEEEIEALCTSIGTVSPKTVCISGGEPLLDRDLLHYIRGAGKIAGETLWICSNGTVITDEFLETAKHEGVSGFSISLLHTDPDKMDALCGRKGVYKKVIDAVTRIKDFGFKLTLEMTILKENYTAVEDIIQVGIDLKVDCIAFKRFRPVGRGKLNSHLALSPEEHQKILHYLYRRALQEKRLKFSIEDPLGCIEFYMYLEEKGESVNDELVNYLGSILGCNAGIRWVGIDPLGNVSPCPLLLYTGLIIGNINERPLDEIIETSKEIHFLRNACGYHNSCKYSVICRGCRTHAAAVTGDYSQKDPMCVHGEYTCPIQHIKDE